jgi:hypothetical protein
MENRLSQSELASLRMLAKGPGATLVPPQETAKLFQMGLLEYRGIEPVVTESGRRLLAEAAR